MERVNPLGHYMIRRDIPFSSPEVAEALGVTRSYLSMLARGKVTPSFKLAFRIEDWSHGNIAVGAWRSVVAS